MPFRRVDDWQSWGKQGREGKKAKVEPKPGKSVTHVVEWRQARRVIGERPTVGRE